MQSILRLTYLFGAAYLSGLAAATDYDECDLVAGDTNVAGVWLQAGTIVTDPKMCQGQGADSFTFSMVISQSSLGLSSGAGSDKSSQNAFGFAIMDNTCKILEAYSRPPACGVPYSIRPNDKNGLKYELNINAIDGGIGSGYYSFNYANGHYAIKNNGCQCNDLKSPGNTAVEACGCAFPPGGEKKMIRQVFTA